MERAAGCFLVTLQLLVAAVVARACSVMKALAAASAELLGATATTTAAVAQMCAMATMHVLRALSLVASAAAAAVASAASLEMAQLAPAASAALLSLLKGVAAMMTWAAQGAALPAPSARATSSAPQQATSVVMASMATAASLEMA